MGAQQDPDDVSDRRRLSFKLANETIRVVIIRNEEILQRSRIIETILHVTSLKKPLTALYLAAPRILATIIDDHILRDYGLGLLLFDDRRIEETIEAKINSELIAAPVNLEPDKNLHSEFTELKSMYVQMEKTIEAMREEIRTMNQNTTRTSEPPPPTRIESQPPRARPYVIPTPNEGPLPSFFNNNPWIEVLSRRGRVEEAPPLAG
jgi:hypothetical protein